MGSRPSGLCRPPAAPRSWSANCRFSRPGCRSVPVLVDVVVGQGELQCRPLELVRRARRPRGLRSPGQTRTIPDEIKVASARAGSACGSARRCFPSTLRVMTNDGSGRNAAGAVGRAVDRIQAVCTGPDRLLGPEQRLAPLQQGLCFGAYTGAVSNTPACCASATMLSSRLRALLSVSSCGWPTWMLRVRHAPFAAAGEPIV